MRAMILAAGRGERMGELTRDVPKPLLRAGDRYLIEYSLQSLQKIGIREVVINVCYRREQIKEVLGNGEHFGLDICYSDEETALETGGGIFKALPLLGSKPFLVLSCDVVTDFPLQNLPAEPKGLGHIVMVENPPYHPRGDYCLQGSRLYRGADKTLTFSNIGVYRPEMFANSQAGRFRLASVFESEMAQLTGESYAGFWHNIGTPADLSFLTLQAEKLIALDAK
jgi:MurNAc alpha-1-phosphate uridylyltransferase